MDKSEKIVKALISDLTDRSGFGNVWDSLDDEIQTEIKREWKNIINSVSDRD